MINSSPTVLLVDELGNDCCLMKLWLETNGYQVKESLSVCDALDDMTDITLGTIPSMILLNSYTSSDECVWMIESLNAAAQTLDIPIVALATHESGDNSNAADDEYFMQVENFNSLKPLMQTLLPVYSEQARAAA